MYTKSEILAMPVNKLLMLARDQIEYYDGRIDYGFYRHPMLDHITEALKLKGILNLKGWVYNKQSEEEYTRMMDDTLHLLERLAHRDDPDRIIKDVYGENGMYKVTHYTDQEIYDAMFWDEQF